MTIVPPSSSHTPSQKKLKSAADAVLLNSRLIFPVVPPTLKWMSPRLPFKDILRITYYPDFQPDLWNICTDLFAVLRKIVTISLTSSVVDVDLDFTEAEKLLLELSSLTKIYSTEDANFELATFGVSKELALADGTKDSESADDKKRKR